MGDRERLQRYVETWRHAVEHLVELVRELPEDDWHRPTDLPGWDVQDNVAHTAHLEAVLAGAPEETLTVDAGGHVRDLAGYYTEQGVLARRDKTMNELLEELERSVALRYDALRADPPEDGS